MLLEKGRIITSFKFISIFILAVMILKFHSVIKKENANISMNNKNNLSNKELNISKEKSFSKLSFFNIQNFCEIESIDIKFESNFFINKPVYYSFAIFLGAFINAKKIMKIGVI
jgi:hypothetical protein